MEPVKVATIGTLRGKRPQRATELRICAKDTCTTPLNSYNRSKYCYCHIPFHVARVRGVVTVDNQGEEE